MLQLPYTGEVRARRPKQARATDMPAAAKDNQRAVKQGLAHKRLVDLESPIIDAKVIVSIVATLAGHLGSHFSHYRTAGSMTAAQMAEELKGDIEQILFAAFKADEMLGELEEQYLAPLDENGGSR